MRKAFKSIFKSKSKGDKSAGHAQPANAPAKAPNAPAKAPNAPAKAPNAPAKAPNHAGAGGHQRASAIPNVEAQSQLPAPAEETEFRVRVDEKMWPAFHPTEDITDLMKAAGPLLFDYTGRLAADWVAGADVTGAFGRPLFHPENGATDQLPPLLFDLVLNQVVTSASVGQATYAAVSHVWGPTMDIDGHKYGVDWKIPVRNENTLLRILEGARVVVGERYIWMDVLCMDQRKRNEFEIANMKSYFTNASGCFVWLDNTYDDPNWHLVLNAIKRTNSFFNLDEYGTPLPGALDRMMQGGSAFDLSLKGEEVMGWIREFGKLATAPWFKRVWTLQEGVIPKNVYFCTPEKYMTGGANIWTITALCETIANMFLKDGSMLGAAVTHELQRSEIHKLLKLRQLYQHREVSFWHLVQAVRTRECKYEQDRVFGLCGMIHKTIPVINYDRSVEGLYEDLYKTYIDDGDFTPCQFLGGQSLLPDKDLSMGYIRPMPANRTETHSLVLTRNGLRMEGIGIDKVTKAHCIMNLGTHMEEWGKKFPDFLHMSHDDHFDFARAFELEPTPYEKNPALCPASFAAFMAMSASGENEIAKLFGNLFQDLLYNNIPPALLQWIKTTYLMQTRNDSAMIMLWTQSSQVQLAVVTESLEGSVVVVMPSSYKDDPGAGCLICQVFPNGNLKKIGIGLGKTVKAADLGAFLLVN